MSGDFAPRPSLLYPDRLEMAQRSPHGRDGALPIVSTTSRPHIFRHHSLVWFVGRFSLEKNL